MWTSLVKCGGTFFTIQYLVPDPRNENQLLLFWHETSPTVSVPVQSASIASFAEILRDTFIEQITKQTGLEGVDLEAWEKNLLLFPVNAELKRMDGDLSNLKGIRAIMDPALKRTTKNDDAFLGPVVNKCKVLFPAQYERMMKILNPNIKVDAKDFDPEITKMYAVSFLIKD